MELDESLNTIYNLGVDLDVIKNKEPPEEFNRITVNYSYPNNTEYDVTATMPRIDFDKECEQDLMNGDGFIISSPKTTIKKDIKDPNGIFSPKFGRSVGDADPFIDRYSCGCGELKGKINDGCECPKCHTLCKYVDDSYKKFGWCKLPDEYPIIHPDIYIQLDSLFGRSKYDKRSRNREKGSKLKNILDYDIGMDVDGHSVLDDISKTDEPFYGKGFIYFIEHFDEIIEYYYKKNPKKKAIYEDIMMDREKVFTHSIPVFTSLLRPVDISSGNMYFEQCTALYNMMTKLVYYINKRSTRSDRTEGNKSKELFNLQMKFNELYKEIVNILNGKRGQLRMLVGGKNICP